MLLFDEEQKSRSQMNKAFLKQQLAFSRLNSFMIQKELKNNNNEE